MAKWKSRLPAPGDNCPSEHLLEHALRLLRRAETQAEFLQPGGAVEGEMGEEIARELEHRGVPRDVSGPVAKRLASCCMNLDPRSYAAALDGAAAAWAAQHVDRAALERSARNIHEIQLLMEGFARELRQLEEGLRVVSAYVLRMHDKANSEGPTDLQ